MTADEIVKICRSAKRTKRDVLIKIRGGEYLIRGPVRKVLDTVVRIGADPNNPKNMIQLPLNRILVVHLAD